ncbi:hypothetical protein [Aeromicrobium massiliense]|uniref:hypothetical protein n=1 Tax=Aeromicrobium massiliense TaxID=1464554 RepID=UPI0002DE901D|nr:hypothetical protein [Aeromicrobium massiliense]
MDLTAPDGSQWRVERRWLPWRLRRRDPAVAADAAMDATSAADGVLLALGLFLLLLVVTVALPWLLVGAVLAVELVLLLALLPVAVVLRAVRVSGWPLDVRREGRLVHAERVRGWRASAERRRKLREAVARGDALGPA